jgi:gliding motility-associated-like protein
MSTDTAVVNIDFRDITFLPNAFSPNGDGLNDVFKIGNINFRRLVEFRIFDRWGKQVFETTNREEGWNGMVGGKAVNSDVYYYIIRLGYADEMVETFKGDVTLIR